MKPNIIFSIAIRLAAFALPFIMACCSQEEPVPQDAREAILHLDISGIGQTRADAADLPANEKMHTVRVIVLHEDGTVEHNRHFPLDGAQARKSIILKVVPDENKRIFLFANEESVGTIEGAGTEAGNETLKAFFESYAEGDSGFEDAVAGIHFAPGYSDGTPIPMSSVYDISFPRQGNFYGEFHVVRVAAKFTINFINMRGEEVNVKSLSIGKHADRNYLMAHVNDSEQNRQLFKGKTWIEWLKEVSEASSENDDYDKTEAAGWLKDYELPPHTQLEYTHPSAVAVPKAEYDEQNPETVEPGKNSIMFYLPESKSIKPGVADGEQEYAMTVDIDGVDTPFRFTLRNLKALFRNTHVVINITIHKDMEMTVDVIRFTSVAVDPDYGLEREDFTGYIVGRDSDGNKCWYNGNYYDPAEAVPLYLGPSDSPESFVPINGKEYLLVYTDFNRTAAKLDHFFERETGKKYLLTPEGITGYKYGDDMYLNKSQQRVWLDSGGDPDGTADEKAVYEALQLAGLNLKCCRILYEWDRWDWNKARWDHLAGVYPKYWFDVLGNRYPWSQGDTAEKRKEKLGEWVKYLEY